MQERLEDLISRIIENLDVEKLDKRIDTYTDYKNKYMILKPSVKVQVELTCGKVITIDITDYFKGAVK